MSSPGLKSLVEPDIATKLFRADDYSYHLRKNTEAYINKYFYRDCEKIFESLRERALAGESLTFDCTINIPKELAVDMAQERLVLFFRQQGYNVIIEPEKDGRQVKLSLRL